MNNVPYDTGKVKIGLTYSPPPPQPTQESEWIQGILLGDKPGWSEVTLATLQSLVVFCIIIAGIFLLGGCKNV